MIKSILSATTLTATGLLTLGQANAHEGAEAAHFVSQSDHTLVIITAIGIIGFGILLWRQRKSKQS